MKVLFVKKKVLIIIAIFAVFILAFSLNANNVQVGATYFEKSKKYPIYSVETAENKLSISFDAAWGADKTSEIMDVCDSYGVKATFFLVGFWVEEYPEKVKEIYNRGFEIGLHSNSHPDMTKLSKTEIEDELKSNIKLIEDLTGFRPKLFRPPYGYYNNSLIDVCESLDVVCIQWSVDSLDWKGYLASDVAGRVVEKSKSGSIILCHNNSDHVINATKMILEHFKQKQMQVVPIGELIYKTNYKINNQGIQIKLDK